jgi:hypothetical protein
MSGITDFLLMLAAWGPNPGHPADLDGDDDVGITDFLRLLGRARCRRQGHGPQAASSRRKSVIPTSSSPSRSAG